MRVCLPIIFSLLLISIDLEAQHLNTVLDANEKLVKIKSGYTFTEGPAVAPDGSVYFTDSPNNKIYHWFPNDSIVEFTVDGERANGLYISQDGQLLACTDQHNMLLKIDLQGNKEILVDNFNDKHLNGPNDVWQHPGGNIYFTDPYYHRPWWPENHVEEQDKRAVYLYSKDNKLSRVAEGFVMPNGIIGTPDGRYLYVADANGKKTWRFKVKKDGTLSHRKLFANEASDGMTIDNEGNLYLTTRMEVLILNKKGRKLGAIEMPEKASNVCFAGEKRDVLFITAHTSVYSIRTLVRGVQ